MRSFDVGEDTLLYDTRMIGMIHTGVYGSKNMLRDAKIQTVLGWLESKRNLAKQGVTSH